MVNYLSNVVTAREDEGTSSSLGDRQSRNQSGYSKEPLRFLADIFLSSPLSPNSD